MEMAMKPAIIVHGGAGAWKLDSDRLPTAVTACQEAAQRGHKILLAGGSALDAVEAATRILEDCPALDAGHGSYLNSAGEVEMDAIIMDGETLNMGAVAAIQRVANPISLARLVMTETEHHLLVGQGAEAFADQMSFPRCSAEQLVASAQAMAETTGTVGAVAIDQNGNLATATSTGGTKGKMPGRVGDSPLVGSGAYADNTTAAVSATGHGESLMKILASKQVCDFVDSGVDAHKACQAAIQLLESRVGGRGGLIAVDASGRVGFAFNTRAMPYAYCIGKEDMVSAYEM